jgi:hypothetical protein
MARKTTIYPKQTWPVKQPVTAIVTEDGRKLVLLQCGHRIATRTAWVGKLRWCPTCSRSSPTADPA